MIKIEEIVEEVTKVPDGPPPPAELGKNLVTIDDARRWLTHPSNWRDMTTFIIKWDGLVPYISRRHGLRLVEEPWDVGIYHVVVRHQKHLRQGGKKDDEPQEKVE